MRGPDGRGLQYRAGTADKAQYTALTRHRLSWVKQNYLRAETLVSANARLVDFQSTLELAGRWGGGEVASADGMRFVTPVKPSIQDLTENILVPDVASPGTTSSLISTLIPRHRCPRHITRFHFCAGRPSGAADRAESGWRS
ncbi:Tn3 family transposase [Enterobacter kobei]|uniref:Tn3 family transposase n=1 Tax=Enterobacter kobei TaxID=208224 RepID=UPI00388FF230